MSTFGSLIAPAAAAAGIGRSLASARVANPRTSHAGSFDEQLDLALKAGARSAAIAGDHSTGTEHRSPALLTLDGAGGIASIESLRVEHLAALTEFEDRFRALLRERGIELGEGVVLQTDLNGEIRVVGDHPQRDAIERLFRDNAELRNSFFQLDHQAKRLRAADVAAELARLQAHEPGAAVAQIQTMFDGSADKTFSLAVQPRQMLVQFT